MLLNLIIISIGLASDAFAVAVCKGLCIKKITYKKPLTIGLYFGLFQSLMPLIGYLLGVSFKDIVASIDHYIAFILLAIIGLNMISESFNEENDIDSLTDFKTMFILSVATSIDALIVGITFAFFKVNIVISILIIGIITFILSFIGVYIGHHFGIKYKNKAEFVGGIVLILMGFKILVEHLFF